MQIHPSQPSIKKRKKNSWFPLWILTKNMVYINKREKSFSRCNTISTYSPSVQLDVHLITSGQHSGPGLPSCGLGDLRPSSRLTAVPVSCPQEREWYTDLVLGHPAWHYNITAHYNRAKKREKRGARTAQRFAVGLTRLMVTDAV